MSSLNNEACPHNWADHFLILLRGLKYIVYTHKHARARASDLLWSSSRESVSQLFLAHPEWWKSAFEFILDINAFIDSNRPASQDISPHLSVRTPPIWTAKSIVPLKRHSIVVHSQRAERVLRHLMGLKAWTLDKTAPVHGISSRVVYFPHAERLKNEFHSIGSSYWPWLPREQLLKSVYPHSHCQPRYSDEA